jgi:hypothetical protein
LDVVRDSFLGTNIFKICKVDSINEASDAASLSPGDAVADFSAPEGTIVVDIGTPPVMILVPLMGGKIACPVCERREIHLYFLNLTDLEKHLSEHHVKAPINWGCRRCTRSFQKLHGARSHIPKCSGNTQGSEGRFGCGACTMSFESQRGLSTHERHAHPAVRNIKRRGTDPPNTASGRAWKEEEVALLKELEIIYKDHRFPNVEISRILTTKTAEQIRNKRKALRNNELLGNLQEVTSTTEGGCDLVEPFVAPSSHESININNEIMVQIWRKSLQNEIEKPAEVPPILRVVYTVLNKIWEENKDDEEALKVHLDEFLKEHLYGALKDKRGKPQKSSLNSNKNAANGKRSKKAARNYKKKYKYARCQELYKECPKRLADVIINNDTTNIQPPKQPPEAGEVQRL